MRDDSTKMRYYHILSYILIFIVINLIHQSTFAQVKTKQLVSSSKADTWVATDGLRRSLVIGAQGGEIRKDKFVGIFYFVWHGAHGYDKGEGRRANGEILDKLPSDTISPYDNSKILAQNPDHPKYGPVGAWHYWGEPYFGYYLPDDEWVIRKHAQMLSDAGIDVIIFDVTNAFIYYSQVSKIARTYESMRREGNTTPSIAFMTNYKAKKQVQLLYDTIYKKSLFKDLWFYWKGRPLMLCPSEALTPETRDFFTTRQSWAWKDHWDGWFGDGKDKWSWVDHTPQAYGWHESKDKPEQISVSIAEHPIYFNVGRSFHDGKEPEKKRSGEGLYFAEQWKRALEVDPEFIFITGWNEWVTPRFKSKEDLMFLGKPMRFAGKPIKKGDDYFMDNFNEEYSRDAEPMKGALNDNYYYQIVDNVRKFKGSRSLPVYKEMNRIVIDGKFADWQNVKAVFTDDQGDTFHRKHPGWGRINEYINTTGRNDIVESKITSDKNNVYFYVKASQSLTKWDAKDWMNLFIGLDDKRTLEWEGFNFLVNHKIKNSTSTFLERCKGGWNWEKIANISFHTAKNELELCIPKKLLGIVGNNFILDFKWVDNSPADGDPMHWLDKGDAAPNARFCYRYIKE